MTPKEAITIANILATADTYCVYCVADLCRQMNEAFPKTDWYALAEVPEKDRPKPPFADKKVAP